MLSYKGIKVLKSLFADDIAFRNIISHHSSAILLVRKHLDLFTNSKVVGIERLSCII